MKKIPFKIREKHGILGFLSLHYPDELKWINIFN